MADRKIVVYNGKVLAGAGGGVSIPDNDYLKQVNDNSLTNVQLDLSTWTSVRPYMFYRESTMNIFPTLPNCITIGQYAFQGVTMPATFELPKVETIGNCAFSLDYIEGGTRPVLSISLPECRSIGSYVFSSCKLCTSLSIPKVTNINTYAFYALGGSTSNKTIELHFAQQCNVGSYAFNGANLKSVTGILGSVAEYAFGSIRNNYCAFDIEVNGLIGTQAFGYLDYATSFKLKGRVSSVGQHAFRQLGVSRSSPSSSIITLDFTNATFTTLGSSYCIGANSSSYRFKYMDISLPEVLATVSGSYSFGYWQYNVAKFLSVPNITQSNVFYNMQYTLLFVPYNQVHEAKVKTNWSSYASWIKGWLPEAESTILPAVNEEGYSLTWYSNYTRGNSALPASAQVTEAIVGEPYYCEISTSQTHTKLKSLKGLDCSVEVTDGINTYQEGDWIPVGTQLTIQYTPNDPSYVIYEARANSTTITSTLSYTVTASAGLAIFVSVYDGVNNPYETTGFANNSWSQIRYVAENRIAEDIGWQIGDTKDTIGEDGNTYTIRIMEFLEGRYYDVDNDMYTYITFDCAQTGTTAEYFFNKETGNKYNPLYGRNYGNSELKAYVDSTLYNVLASDLKAQLHNIKIKYFNHEYQGDSSVSDAIVKIFINSYGEINANSNETISYKTGSILGKLAYWNSHNSDSYRTKYKAGTTTGAAWWTRTLITVNEMTGNSIGSGGQLYESYIQSGTTYYVSFMFAM